MGSGTFNWPDNLLHVVAVCSPNTRRLCNATQLVRQPSKWGLIHSFSQNKQMADLEFRYKDSEAIFRNFPQGIHSLHSHFRSMNALPLTIPPLP